MSKLTDLSAREQGESRCKHFNGVLYQTCRAGVSYDDVNTNPPGQGLDLPCIRDPLRSVVHKEPRPLPPCDKREWKTQAELDAEMELVVAFLTNFADELRKGIEHCVHCGADVDRLEQVGRCVYARPCGCRQYQGELPKEGKS